MKAESTAFNIFNGIGKKYIDGLSEGEGFYEYSLKKNESFEVRKADVLEQYSCNREKIVGILKEKNAYLGLDSYTMDNIDKLLDASSLAVVTGQQAGFMTGPMYTVFKAITAIKLAKEKEQELGVPVVPVFWIASEDHDFEEVANTYIATNKLERISIKRPSHVKSSVGNIKINCNIEFVSGWFLDHFKDEPFFDELSEIVNTSLESAANLAEFFSRIIAKLFKNQGLIIIDPMWADIRDLQKEFIKDVISNRAEINKIFNQTTERLIKDGNKKQISLMENGINLFREVNGSRQRLEYNSESQTIESQDGSFIKGADDIYTDIENGVSSYSMNVVLRPVGQDVLLPTLAYVAGPGEMNYYSQLKEVYKIFGKTMPIIYPRENFTIVENKFLDLAKNFNIDIASSIPMNKSVMHKTILEDNDSYSIDQRFDDFFKMFDDNYDKLLYDLKNEFDGINDFEVKNKQLICYQIEYLKKKVKLQNRKKNKDLLVELDVLLDHISPMEHLQERSFSFLMYYSRYGDQLIDWLIKNVEIDLKHRLIIT